MPRWLLSLLLVAATTLRAAPRIDVRPDLTPPGSVIVELRPSATLAQFRHDVAELDHRSGKTATLPIRHEYTRALFGAAVELPQESVDALRRLAYVKAVHPDRTVTMCAIASTSATIDAATRVNAASLPTRGEGITVGILDTGIDYNHPALGGGFGAGHKVAGGWDFVNGDADPLDDNGHGTHVAGIVAADSAELGGVAPAATLIAYKVLDGLGRGRESDVLAAIERSIDPNQDGDPSDHLDVINLSLGGAGTADDLPSQAVDRATAAGVIVVIAAGNEGQFDTVRSPGTARTAITVGAIDDAGNVTSFSSRGPSPAILALKPDVVAPGQNVVSARRGGGTVAMSGTSMATPHVTGVAALLVKLHPEWTPANVKSAIVTSAGTIAGLPIARAAGRVDAANAAARTTFLDNAGISFGLASGKTGTWSQTRTVTLTNRGASARDFQILPTTLPSGITFTATPSSVSVPAGGTKSVDLRLDINNVSVPTPADVVYGGDIQFLGVEKLVVPWIVVRAARMTVTLDSAASSLVAMSGETHVTPLMYDVDKGEFFGTAGTTWDVILTTADFDEVRAVAFRLVVAEDRMMNGDDVVALHRDDANNQITVDGRDEYGIPLGPSALDAVSYWLTLTFDYTKDGKRQELNYHLGHWSQLKISPLSSSFVLYPFETFADFRRARSFNVQHAPLTGITESKTLTLDTSSYVHARLRFNRQSDPNYLLSQCVVNGLHTDEQLIDLHSIWCFTDIFQKPVAIDYYTTSDSGVAGSGIMFATSDIVIPSMRGIDGAIVSTELTPSPAAYRITNDEDITIGAQPLFPLAFYGTTNGNASDWLRPGLTGAIGELQYAATRGTAWTWFDAQNNTKGTGTIDQVFVGLPVLPVPGDRFVATRDGLLLNGRPSRGEMEVHYGSDQDFKIPTLTSLRIVNGNGRIVDHVDAQSNAAVEFSAADWDYYPDTHTLPMKTNATHAFYRVNGTTEWHPLPVAITGADNGSLLESGRMPAGDLYRADLTAATALPGAIDVRLEVEDVHGNRASWTQSPAFIVSAGKRRAAR